MPAVSRMENPWTLRGDEMTSVASWFKRLSSDRREAQRLNSPMLVAYYWNGSVPMSHKIQNISSTGFYLLTEERWPQGTIVTITLQRTAPPRANSGSEKHIAVLSRVVRTGEDGVAFAFVPIESETEGLKSSPVGRKAINSFLDQVKSDRGYAVVEHIEAGLKAKLSRQASGSAVPEDPWREGYEEPER